MFSSIFLTLAGSRPKKHECIAGIFVRLPSDFNTTDREVETVSAIILSNGWSLRELSGCETIESRLVKAGAL